MRIKIVATPCHVSMWSRLLLWSTPVSSARDTAISGDVTLQFGENHSCCEMNMNPADFTENAIESLEGWASMVILRSRWTLRRQCQSVRNWLEGWRETTKSVCPSRGRNCSPHQQFLCSHPNDKQNPLSVLWREPGVRGRGARENDKEQIRSRHRAVRSETHRTPATPGCERQYETSSVTGARSHRSDHLPFQDRKKAFPALAFAQATKCTVRAVHGSCRAVTGEHELCCTGHAAGSGATRRRWDQCKVLSIN